MALQLLGPNAMNTISATEFVQRQSWHTNWSIMTMKNRSRSTDQLRVNKQTQFDFQSAVQRSACTTLYANATIQCTKTS